MRVCSSCGKQLNDNAVTCSYCGYGFKEEKGVTQLSPANVEKIQEGALKVSRAIGVITGLPFLIIGALMLFGTSSNFANTVRYKGEAKAVYKESIDCVFYEDDNYETCDIVYKFIVDDKEYTYTDELVSEEYFVGEIDVIYSEKNPSKNAKKNSEGDLIGLIIGLIFFVVGFGAVSGKVQVKGSVRY